jgi:HPt (histidine-containing phosphotransfer) domain-containing protein
MGGAGERMHQVLDMAVIDELLSLCDDGDPELLLDLIQLYLDDSPAKIQGLQTGLASGDMDLVERAAHALKGSSGNLGARLLQETCEQLQLTARQPNQTRIQQLVAQAQTEFAAVCSELARLQRQFAATSQG